VIIEDLKNETHRPIFLTVKQMIRFRIQNPKSALIRIKHATKLRVGSIWRFS